MNNFESLLSTLQSRLEKEGTPERKALAFVDAFEKNAFGVDDPYPVLILDSFTRKGRGILDLYVEFRFYDDSASLSDQRTIDSDGERCEQVHLELNVDKSLYPSRLAEWDHLAECYRDREERQKRQFLSVLESFLFDPSLRFERLFLSDSL